MMRLMGYDGRYDAMEASSHGWIGWMDGGQSEAGEGGKAENDKKDGWI